MKTYLPILVVGLLAGCSTKEAIVFNDELQIIPLEQNSVPLQPFKKGLGKAESQQIETAVFAWLLQRPIGDDSTYSAIFLKTDETITETLMKQFPAHFPPLKQLWHLEIRPNRSPMDCDTGRPAFILTVDALDPDDGRVEAVGRWFGGEAATGFHKFELKKINDVWQIQTVK